ncbi:hypothetical protein C3F09_02795 [candidate division GN15 bacterium]|uniref:Photosynthesis system II assembly factor Ycf48/Hcf136-like domain-containing protein n=1 Tax=candidate division GN15 bacterium TaxID=2072418 RepID=A0A855X9P0_9BACT|nr:MAG: hypothetical protein C3F09_02795 [candidate division GN15 bacterium]
MKLISTRQSKNRCYLVAALILALTLPSMAAENGWTELKFPVHETITGISFVSPKLGYVVTSGSKYARTNDSGKTWNVYTLGKEDPQYDDVFFLNADTGIICGQRGFAARTTDGCKNWVRSFWGDTTIWLTSVIMLEGGSAVMVGLIPGEMPKGEVFRSTDAALNWKQLPDSGYGFGELFYRKGEPICFQSYGKLHYSVDSGRTWSTLKTVAGKTGRATSFYGQTGVICGNNAMIACTWDRGRTWTPIESREEKVHFTSVELVDQDTGYVAGTSSTLMKTINAGKSWRPEPVLKDTVDFACMKLVGKYLYIGGTNGVLLRKKVK